MSIASCIALVQNKHFLDTMSNAELTTLTSEKKNTPESVSKTNSTRNKNYQREKVAASHGGIAPSGAPLRAVNTSHPVSVTRNVCSNCAEGLPFSVTAVQLSGHNLSPPSLPKLIIGSTVKTCPGFITPTALFFL